MIPDSSAIAEALKIVESLVTRLVPLLYARVKLEEFIEPLREASKNASRSLDVLVDAQEFMEVKVYGILTQESDALQKKINQQMQEIIKALKSKVLMRTKRYQIIKGDTQETLIESALLFDKVQRNSNEAILKMKAKEAEGKSQNAKLETMVRNIVLRNIFKRHHLEGLQLDDQLRALGVDPNSVLPNGYDVLSNGSDHGVLPPLDLIPPLETMLLSIPSLPDLPDIPEIKTEENEIETEENEI